MWQSSLPVFLKDLTPVETVEESTDQYTTREIQHILQEHTGLPIDMNELYVALLDANCHYVRQGSEMLWLFKNLLP